MTKKITISIFVCIFLIMFVAYYKRWNEIKNNPEVVVEEHEQEIDPSKIDKPENWKKYFVKIKVTKTKKADGFLRYVDEVKFDTTAVFSVKVR